MEPIHKRDAQKPPADTARSRKLVVPSLDDKTYFGRREIDGSCRVWVQETALSIIGDVVIGDTIERTLSLRLEIRSHSPTGFQWGYCGSGPAQLALALLADALGDTELAQMHYQDFKRAFAASWGDSWSITASEIRGFVARKAGH